MYLASQRLVLARVRGYPPPGGWGRHLLRGEGEGERLWEGMARSEAVSGI